MKCKKCEEYYRKYPIEIDDEDKMVHRISKSVTVSKIDCYFDNEKGCNWNCQTLSDIRNLFDWDNDNLPNGVLHYNFEDQNVVIMDISEIEYLIEPDNCLRNIWFTWYKNRGVMDNIKILSENRNPRNPTEKEILEIIKYYQRT